MNGKFTVKEALEKTIIVVTAGGDASRLVPATYRNRLQPASETSMQVPLWVRQHCLAVHPVPGLTNITFLQFILLNILETLGKDTPVAVITGPNTHSTISAHLDEHARMGLHRLEVIQQGALPVFTPEGELLLWEDGSPLKAPDGTAGCLRALQGTESFKQWVKSGYQYVFLWYGNDLTVGMHIAEYFERSKDAIGLIQWVSDTMGLAKLNEINPQLNATDLPKLVMELEDAHGAYILLSQAINDELLTFADWHAVHRPVPILLPNGEFLKGIKRELFLCDVVWKLQHLLPNVLEALTSIPEPVRQPIPNAMGQTCVTEIQRIDSPLLSFPLHFKSKQVAEDLAAPSKTPVESPNRKQSHSTSRIQQYIDNYLSLDKLIDALESPQTTQSIELNVGQKNDGDFLIEDYKTLRVERGGWGIVYVCQRQESGQMVAVKTIKDELRWTHRNLVSRLWHEANCWITIPPHPHIVQAYKVQEIDGRLHIFMEYVENGSLHFKLCKGYLNLVEGLELGLQICDGLQAIHRAEMIHRDIKPDNVLLTEDGKAKITDLGLVAALYDKRWTEPVETLPYYMAPEQMESPEDITFSTDIYSLGVVLYEVLTGEKPFLETNWRELLSQKLNTRPHPPQDVKREILYPVSEMIVSCLEPDPKNRPSLTAIFEELSLAYAKLTGQYYTIW